MKVIQLLLLTRVFLDCSIVCDTTTRKRKWGTSCKRVRVFFYFRWFCYLAQVRSYLQTGCYLQLCLSNHFLYWPDIGNHHWRHTVSPYLGLSAHRRNVPLHIFSRHGKSGDTRRSLGITYKRICSRGKFCVTEKVTVVHVQSLLFIFSFSVKQDFNLEITKNYKAVLSSCN